MSGQAGVPWAPIRALLHVASWAYRVAVALRNRRYDRAPSRVQRLSVPVISIGNITTGGTGKTPLVIDVVERLQRLGRQPAVVSRGYRSRSGADADELLLVRRHCVEVVTVAEPDRVAGGRRAIEIGADVIVLDDAFQHRRIHRDLDIVVIDATRPFGFGHLLPRGLLREPMSALRRADVVIFSRADAVDSAVLEAAQRQVRRVHPHVPILRCRHRPTHLARLDGSTADVSSIHGTPVLTAAGIGNPSAFEDTLTAAGGTVVGTLALPDHAAFDRAQFVRLREAAARTRDAAMLVVTEKDLVKLDPAVWCEFPLPICALAIKIEFIDQDGEELDQMLGVALAEQGSEGAHGQRQVSAR